MITKPTLLTYRFSTQPAPLQVSVGGVAAQATINLSVAAGSAAAYCNQIVIAIPIGYLASDLSNTAPTSAVNTGKWTVSSAETVRGSDIGLQGTRHYARFVFQTRDKADNKIDYNLVLSIEAEVNKTVGAFEYMIQEMSGPTNEPASFTAKTAVFNLNKMSEQFYLKNFVATAPGAPTVPSTEFANGDPIHLSWESNSTFFRIYEKNKTTPVYEGTDSAFTVQGGAKTGTTYILAASVTAGGDSSERRTLLYDSLTVTISNPDLMPSSLAVSGKTTLQDTSMTRATVAGQLSANNVTVEGNLAVGTLSPPGGEEGILRVKDNVVLAVQHLTATGRSQIRELTTGYLDVQGAITIREKARISSLDASGDVEVGDKLHVRGDCYNETGSWIKYSDRSLKENICPYNGGLTQILDMNPVKYRFKKETGLGAGREHVGLIAQDLEAIAPNMVNKVKLSPDHKQDVRTTDPGPLTYMLINAVKELKAEIDALKANR